MAGAERVELVARLQQDVGFGAGVLNGGAEVDVVQLDTPRGQALAGYQAVV